MRKYQRATHHRRYVVELFLAQRGPYHLALGMRPGEARPRPGRDANRERAIADALHCSRIFYANANVERDVLLAESRCERIRLLLEGETLHNNQAA